MMINKSMKRVVIKTGIVILVGIAARFVTRAPPIAAIAINQKTILL